ncbi:hypothetical protein PGT21_017137 [Puccinia graminis f. sp. tritici]|uniref:Uncharacterized protein n=1 Tax=Puccinia graminis f. sp. tritici TaxID=56615 RepID=A0A5B0MWY5_PUCGR|nr:hypothetical protein PGT21_017137 [Puccinia graminis f. sp. tritici]
MDDDGLESSPASSVFDDTSADSDDVDADVLESHLDRKRKNRRGHQKSSKEQNKVSKIAKSRPLPHQASALVASVIGFIRYMMGLANSKSPLPAPPSETEVSQWANLVKARRETILKKLNVEQPANVAERGQGGSVAANEKFRRKERLTAIRKEGVQPVEYTPAPEIPPEARSLPISFQTKTQVDNEFQSKGFSRITFEWKAPQSLSASRWNMATALILIEHWSRWYKTQPHDQNNLQNDIQGVVERWLGSMRSAYSKQLQSAESAQTAPSAGGGREESTSAVTASDRTHVKTRKKV